jgi:hypothetical protein
MTRRKFFQILTKTSAAIIFGIGWIATTPRRFVRAARLKKYPGNVKSLPDVTGPSKWSG